MKRKIFTLLISILSLTAWAEETSIIMTTLKQGAFEFKLSVLHSNKDYVTIDWGDGSLVEYKVAGDTLISSPRNLTGTTTIKVQGCIYGIKCDTLQLTKLEVKNLDNSTGPWPYVSCSGNQLTSLDLSQAAVVDLSCGGNLLTSLNVKNNPKLFWLDCCNNLLTSLDISHNPALKYFDCPNNQLKTIDVSHNPNLYWFFCSNNLFTTLDVSHNPALNILDCGGNCLTSLDVSKNRSLYGLGCSDNYLTFSTLPVYKYEKYFYSPQKNIRIGANDMVVDLSSQHIIKDETGKVEKTIYAWFTTDSVKLVKGVDYEEKDGVFTFLNTLSENIYCEMKNSVFPGLVLRTTNIKLQSQLVTEEIEIVGFNNEGKFEIGFCLPSNATLTGSFLLQFPEGVTLDMEQTLLSDELSKNFDLVITPQKNNTWLLEIKAKSLKSLTETGTYQTIMDIAYLVDPALEKGTYEALIKDLDFELNDGTHIIEQERAVNIEVFRYGTAIDKINSGKGSIHLSGQNLVVDTENAESIEIYSVSGVKLYSGSKAAGKAEINISGLPQGVLIIRGGSGWTTKVVK